MTLKQKVRFLKIESIREHSEVLKAEHDYETLTDQAKMLPFDQKSLAYEEALYNYLSLLDRVISIKSLPKVCEKFATVVNSAAT